MTALAATLGATHPTSAADIVPVTGPELVRSPARPKLPASHAWACSDQAPVCVHATSPALDPQVLPTLRDLEAAAFRVHRLLRWPAPMPDHSLGGNAGFDVYLSPTSFPFFEVVPDAPDLWTGLDRTSAFALIQPGLPDACYRASTLAEVYARAALFSVDAAAQSGLANASAAFVASRAFHCPVTWLADLDDVQAAPQLALSSTSIDRGRGNMLFPWFFQDTRGVEGTVDLIHAVWSLSSQQTPLSAKQYVNEPDVLDVLARLDDGRAPTLDALLLEYAVDRAFAGDRDDGLHLPDTRFLGPAGAVRFDASLAWPALPRRVGSTQPIEPTGSSYVWLDLSGVAPDAGLIAQARWEQPTRFRFSFLRVGADGSPISRIDPPLLQRDTETQVTLDNIGGAAGLLIVACNVGPLLADIAFDPDAVPYNASAYSLSLYAQAPADGGADR